MKEKIIYNLTKIEEIDKYGFSEEEKNILRLIKSKDERELESMAVSNERIKEAMEQLEKINADDELKMELYYLEKQRLDENTSRRYREMAEEARKKAEQDCKKAKQARKKAEQDCKKAEQECKRAEQDCKKAEQECKRAEQDCKRAEQECRLAQKESTLAQQALKKVEEERKNVEQSLDYALKQIEEKDILLIKTLYETGKKVDKIVELTNLDINYIKNILNN